LEISSGILAISAMALAAPAIFLAGASRAAVVRKSDKPGDLSHVNTGGDFDLDTGQFGS